MKKVILFLLIVGMRIGLASGIYAWTWVWGRTEPFGRTDMKKEVYTQLTQNNGARAVAMREYKTGGTYKIRLLIAAREWTNDWDSIVTYEWSDLNQRCQFFPKGLYRGTTEGANPCVAMGECDYGWKVVAWADIDDRYRSKRAPFSSQEWTDLQKIDSDADENMIAIAAFPYNNVYVVYDLQKETEGVNKYALFSSRSSDNAEHWEDPVPIVDWTEEEDPDHPSLGVHPWANVFLVYEKDGAIWFTKSTDAGVSWQTPHIISQAQQPCFSPCLANYENTLFVCFKKYEESNYKLYYRWSTDGGAN